MSTVVSLIERLQQFGMSGYEAKAYLALIAAGEPLNGYEVAKRSGVPRSTVYETLGKLTASGATYEVRSAGDAVSYLPLPPKSLLDRLGRHYQSTLSSLREDLLDIATPPRLHLIHNLAGRSALLERARDIITDTQRDVFVSGWAEELEAVEELLHPAERRGVSVTVLSFGETAEPVAHTYQHVLSAPEVALENLGCRLFVAVADRTEAVIGGFDGDDAWGIYTDNPAVVLLAVEYVRHDIAIQLVASHFTEDEVMEFWKSNRDIVRLRSDHGLPGEALRSGRGARNGKPTRAEIATARKPPRRRAGSG